MMGEEIGGYFELELSVQSDIKYPQAQKYQSARASFLALLRAVKPQRVWMPHYICNAMRAPVQEMGLELCSYAIDANFAIAEHIDLREQDILLYVNFFGVCGQQVDHILEHFNPSQVVIDCSQAFYAEPKECLATIYSPRKFFGVPDGGLLVTDFPVALPSTRELLSQTRMGHLIKRLGGGAEAGYADFKQAEEGLGDMEPRLMSVLTEKLLASIDTEAARLKRNCNFQYLHENLRWSNGLELPEQIDGPLCYPYLPHGNIQRENFVQSKIFIATYWPDVLGRVDKNSVESKLVNQCLPIPCDQRYGKAEMNVLIDRVLRDSVS